MITLIKYLDHFIFDRVKQIQGELGSQIQGDFEEAFQGAGAKVIMILIIFCHLCSEIPLSQKLFLTFNNM